MITMEKILAEFGDTPRMKAFIRTAALLLDVRGKIQTDTDVIFEVNAFINHVKKDEAGYYEDNDKIETLEKLYERLKNFPDKPKGEPSLTFDCYMRERTKEMRRENFVEKGTLGRAAFVFSGSREEKNGYSSTLFAFYSCDVHAMSQTSGAGFLKKYEKLLASDLKEVRESIAISLQKMSVLQKDKPVIETVKVFLENPTLFLLENNNVGPGLWNEDSDLSNAVGHLTQ